MRHVWLFLCLAVVSISVIMLIQVAKTTSPNLDEVGHLPAGLAVVRYSYHDLYVVNPPLVKAMASLPLLYHQPVENWRYVQKAHGFRTEWMVGSDFITVNGADAFRLFAIARMSLLPIWICGLAVTIVWAREISDASSSIAVALLMCFSPCLLAWTATICPDSAAAMIGALAIFIFRRWLMNSGGIVGVACGFAVGLSMLTKTTWLILLPILTVLATLIRHGSPCRDRLSRLFFITVVAVYTVNLGYRFDRSFQPLKNFQFFSSTFAGRRDDGSMRQRVPSDAGNRFASTYVGYVPVPLPASFVEGIDLQKYDFEEGKWSYLRGEHKFGGWWYWYIYALMVKTPVGTILLFFITCGWFLWRIEWRRGFQKIRDGSWRRRSGPSSTGEASVNSASPLEFSWLHENLILLAPSVCVFVLVSSQTGFSRYLRYILPCYPFVFIWISQIFSEKSGLPSWLRKVCWALLAWSIISSLAVFPHSMSYFNELAGGPENGPAHLIDASIDWGQDVLFLADWCEEHPEAKPLYLSLHVFFDPRIAGIEYEHPPYDPRFAAERGYLNSEQIGPKPGWYAVSVHQLYSRNEQFAYLFDFPKADMVGYSIYIYHLTQQDVARWNNEHGFQTPETPTAPPKSPLSEGNKPGGSKPITLHLTTEDN